jgi:hypothetical protein
MHIIGIAQIPKDRESVAGDIKLPEPRRLAVARRIELEELFDSSFGAEDSSSRIILEYGVAPLFVVSPL